MTAKTINFRDLPPDERKELLSALESDVKQVAGDDLSTLCETVQDAVREVIRVARDRDERYEETFDELRIEVYAYPHAFSKSLAWGINSLITGVNTKRGIVE